MPTDISSPSEKRPNGSGSATSILAHSLSSSPSGAPILFKFEFPPPPPASSKCSKKGKKGTGKNRNDLHNSPGPHNRVHVRFLGANSSLLIFPFSSRCSGRKKMKIRMKKKKSNEPPQPSRPPNSGPRGRCFRRRRRSAVAARGPLGHVRHLGPALRGPGGRVEAGPRRPCPARAEAARGPLVLRLLGAQTPPGRGTPGHPQVADTKSGQEIFRGPRGEKNHPRRRVPLAA